VFTYVPAAPLGWRGLGRSWPPPIGRTNTLGRDRLWYDFVTFPIGILRSDLSTLPLLAKFAIGMAIIVCVPRLSHRVRLPAVVGFILSGMAIGPHGLNVFGQHRPIVDFLADLGKLLLMFFAGLEIDLTLFRRSRNKSIRFGLLTTGLPLALGSAVGFLFGYDSVSAIVLGSLLASHTLLALPIIAHLDETRLEPVTVTVGATVLSDTLSLVMFAVCVSIWQSGFSMPKLAILLTEIAVVVPVILVGLGRLGAYALKKVELDEGAYFILMFAILAVAALIAQTIQLPGIVGAFLAGLAVNVAVHDKPAKQKLKFFGDTLFIPIFFVATGFLIDPLAFLRSITDNPALVFGIVGALVIGKWFAAEVAGRAFGYSHNERMTIWSLTLPQVAATLAATLVAVDTFDPAGQRLIDNRLLNVVLVLVLTTSILGPVLTERFAPRLLTEAMPPASGRAA
jgi:Kef-type K+ transport system membrane component KefB